MLRSPFHLVEFSPWPLFCSMGAFFLTTGTAAWLHLKFSLLMIIGLLLILITMIQWWRDVVRESTFQGYHTFAVTSGLRWGMILFIASEVCFFGAFFWAFFHSSLVPDIELGSWPPVGIKVINPFSVPLLNTAVLLSSGLTVTWCHHSLMEGDLKNSIQSLFVTVLLGLYFTGLQASEYYEASFSISDGIYGTTFYVATGFHGLHVLIGTTFLLITLLRIISNHMSTGHHFGFEAAAWYWHFVDVVWLFLFLSIYWWGS
uniref:Cytochrome c oxidase subunit 3 n=1 Tax=Falcidens acutargatus TaxID=2079778 RepID=A0A343X869_9MOLL|nr:cytochrome c oxidase subunit III [Falcidens acutargatus]AWH02128.1 cytochrome c oxidase subunit 3 [Falcidens acutargatus]